MSALPQPAWWRGKRVLVTGHTGFVGGWLSAWLDHLGAKVSGIALAPDEGRGFFESYGLGARLAHDIRGDIRDAAAVRAAFDASQPQVLFHLAAQPIVRDAYRDPVGTFATNVMGTVHVLEACREQASVEKALVFTTDKVYRNDQSGRPLAESDRLGGNEPYSASKAGAEFATAAWWESYFRRAGGRPALAVVRAGNIIGGGDWARDRLLPDAVRAFATGEELVIRNPKATRPWQHVIDAVRATLVVAEREEAPSRDAAQLAWNFGPAAGEVHPVEEVVTLAADAWGSGARWRVAADESIPESRARVLSSERARSELGWQAQWPLPRAVEETIAWYRQRQGDIARFTLDQVERHCDEVRAA